jgi:hypothetical protein
LQWQVYQAEAKCTEHLLLAQYTLFYTLVRKAECTLYTLTKKMTFFFRKLYVVLNLTLSVKISRLWTLVPVSIILYIQVFLFLLDLCSQTVWSNLNSNLHLFCYINANIDIFCFNFMLDFTCEKLIRIKWNLK